MCQAKSINDGLFFVFFFYIYVSVCVLFRVCIYVLQKCDHPAGGHGAGTMSGHFISPSLLVTEEEDGRVVFGRHFQNAHLFSSHLSHLDNMLN